MGRQDGHLPLRLTAVLKYAPHIRSAAWVMTRYRTALTLFAAAAVVAFIFAAITTLNRVETRQASNEAPPGTIGLAHPHPPVDKSPGVPLQTPTR